MPKLTTKSTRTLLLTDYAYAISADGTEDGKVPYSDIGELIGGGSDSFTRLIEGDYSTEVVK